MTKFVSREPTTPLGYITSQSRWDWLKIISRIVAAAAAGLSLFSMDHMRRVAMYPEYSTELLGGMVAMGVVFLMIMNISSFAGLRWFGLAILVFGTLSFDYFGFVVTQFMNGSRVDMSMDEALRLFLGNGAGILVGGLMLSVLHFLHRWLEMRAKRAQPD